MNVDESRSDGQTLRIDDARGSVPLPPLESAKAAGLRYVNDAHTPGIRRVGASGRFRYVGPEGRRIVKPADRARIKALVIPPAWTDVWISPDPRGHLQAVG